jgi:hypothetical protein
MVPICVNGKTYRSIQEASAETGIPYRLLWEQRHNKLLPLTDDDVVAARPVRKEQHNPKRIQLMIALREAGLSLQEIGEAFGVTREWVRQLLSNSGVDLSKYDCRRKLSYGEQCAVAYADQLSHERQQSAQVSSYGAAMAVALCDDE